MEDSALLHIVEVVGNSKIDSSFEAVVVAFDTSCLAVAGDSIAVAVDPLKVRHWRRQWSGLEVDKTPMRQSSDSDCSDGYCC